MRKILLPLLITVFLFSCSEDECSYRGEREGEILLEIKELEVKRDNASTALKGTYQSQIDALQNELTSELGKCD